ncbi:MAG: hypothetical protein ABIG95_00900 [Candidatus Woesearchaeota archaeon]
MRGKRAQLTIFLFTAIVITLSVAVFFYLGKGQDRPLIFQDQASVELRAEKQALEQYISECLKSSLEAGIINDGIYSNNILQTRIEQEVEQCVAAGLLAYKARGIEFEQEYASEVKVEVQERSILARLYFPLLMKKDKAATEFGQYEHSLSRVIAKRLSTDPNGVVQQTAVLASEDDRVLLNIPEGVIARKSDGSPVEQVTMKLEDGTLFAGDFISYVVYDLQPENATFSPGVQLSIYYGDYEYPSYINPATIDVKIAYYDSKQQKYITVPSYNDKAAKKVYANITHFSPWGAVINEEEVTTCSGLSGVAPDVRIAWFCYEEDQDGNFNYFRDTCLDDDQISKYYCYDRAFHPGGQRCASTVYSCSAYLQGSVCRDDKCGIESPTVAAQCQQKGLTCSAQIPCTTSCTLAGVDYRCTSVNGGPWSWKQYGLPKCIQSRNGWTSQCNTNVWGCSSFDSDGDGTRETYKWQQVNPR